MEKPFGSSKIWSVLFIVFIVLLALFTLFSNTLQNAMLPKVITGNPGDQPFNRTIKAEGRIQATTEKEVTSIQGCLFLAYPLRKVIMFIRET